jgi:hypothetical protein
MQRLVVTKMTDALDPRSAPAGRDAASSIPAGSSARPALLRSCQQHPADRTFGDRAVGAAGQQIRLPDKRGDLACGWPRAETSRGAPTWTTRPSNMTTTQSAMLDASSWSWVTKMAVASVHLRMARTSSRKATRSAASRRERLIQQHQSGLRRQCTRQRNPLLLSTRELMRVPASVSSHP